MRITPGGHRVIFDASFDRFTLLSEDEVCDFIDMFFSYDDKSYTWVIRNENKSVDFNGQHMHDPNGKRHIVSFSEKNIRKRIDEGMRRFGGNVKISDIDPKAAAALVLAHELQHANQSKLHGQDERFYGYLGGYNKRGKPRMKRYKNRACENDARAFVDSHLNEIFAYLDRPAPRRSKENEPPKDDLLGGRRAPLRGG